MPRVATALLVAAVAATFLVAGCSSKPKLRQPVKLVPVEHPQFRPHEVWSRRVGDGSDGMVSGLRLVVEDDALFTASEDGLVFALNPASGETIWRTKTHARVIAGPTVAGDQVYVGTLDGELIALARKDGAERWRSKFNAEIVAPCAAGRDLVIVRTVDGREYAVTASDGATVWNFDRNEPNLTLRGMSPPVVADGRVFTGLDSGKLAALNLPDGVLLWEQNISVPSGRSELERLTDIDANLLIGRQGVFVVTYGNDIALIDPLNGDSRWRRSIRSYSGLAQDDRYLYVTDSDGWVWAIDPDSGGAVWKSDQLKYRRLSAPGTFDGYTLVGDFEGWLHWFDPHDGRIVARTRLAHDPVTTAPVADEHRVYVMDVGGHVAAYTYQRNP